MRTLSHLETLVYYDGPELFVGRDQLGVPYICLMVEKADESEKYICVPTSKGRLNDFVSGNIDLLSTIKTPETGEIFVAIVKNGNFEHIPLLSLKETEVPPEWLPEPDFFLKPQPVTNVRVIEESRDRRRAIIHCSLNPPEARQDPKIAAQRLGQFVTLIQRVVSHAFRKALRDVDEITREAINRLENYQLEIFAFSPGSFTLHMQTTAPADMFGYSHIEKALRIIDVISEHIDDPNTAVEFIAGYGGHFAAAYRDLLQFIVENETPLSYEWSMPERNYITARKISDKQANPVYRALVERVDIGIEEKRFVGIVRKVDETYGSWRLEIDEKKYSGRSDREKLHLGGIVIGARYEFICEERLEEERGTGKESTVLYLKSYRPL